MSDRNPDEAGFLWIDKQNGHLLYQDVTPELPSESELIHRVSDKIKIIDNEKEPERTFLPIPEGKSGNMKLDTKCSYCDFKKHCWRDVNGGTGLRTFLYNWGPVSLTEVKREPRVPEINDA